MKGIIATEKELEKQGSKLQAEIEAIESDASTQIAKMQDDSKKQFEQSITKQAKKSQAAAVELKVEKKKQDQAVKFVTEKFWNFVK